MRGGADEREAQAAEYAESGDDGVKSAQRVKGHVQHGDNAAEGRNAPDHPRDDGAEHRAALQGGVKVGGQHLSVTAELFQPQVKHNGGAYYRERNKNVQNAGVHHPRFGVRRDLHLQPAEKGPEGSEGAHIAGKDERSFGVFIEVWHSISPVGINLRERSSMLSDFILIWLCRQVQACTGESGNE